MYKPFGFALTIAAGFLAGRWDLTWWQVAILGGLWITCGMMLQRTPEES